LFRLFLFSVSLFILYFAEIRGWFWVYDKFALTFTSETIRVLKEKEEKQYGEYRTKPYGDSTKSSFQFSALFQQLLK